MAVETTINHSIYKLKEKQDKTFKLDSHCLMSLSGDIADRDNFGALVRVNTDFQRFKNNGRRASVKRSAEYVRGELAKAIRKSMKQVSPVIIGYDVRKQAQLYWMDYLGTIADVNYCSQGYSSYFVTSVLATNWKEGMDKAQARELVDKCIQGLRTRFMIAQNHYDLWHVDANGVTKLQE